LKNKLLRDVAKREINYVLNLGKNIGSKKIRLERALEKAYEWQNSRAPDFVEEVNGRNYYGPLKWIICLLGDDVYEINKF